MSFTYRENQNTPLTWSQLDGNFREVENVQLEVSTQVMAAAASAESATSASAASQSSAELAEEMARISVVRWCGNSTTPPTTRLDGSPLEISDEYGNLTDNLRYNWNGSAWIALNSSAQQLEVALVDPTGSAKVHHDSNSLATILNYHYNVKTAGIPVDGSDATAQMQALVAKFTDTGAVVEFQYGLIKVTQPFQVKGFVLDIGKNAEIMIYGENQNAFYNGGIEILPGGVVSGEGNIYTSGPMGPTFGSTFPSRATAVFVNGGDFIGDVAVYSQLFSCIKHTSGKVQGRTIGGAYRPLYSELSIDQAHTFDCKQFNAGIAYRDKAPYDFIIRDVRGTYIKALALIKNRVTVGGSSAFCAKNSVWIEGDATNTGAQLPNLVINMEVTRAGFYIDAAGNIADGHGAGTCIEVLNAPDVKINGKTSMPRGYNIALAAGCHAAVVDGIHQGNGGDPVVVVANSNDCIIGGVLDKGTVAVSAGEAGATANNTIITATIKNMSSAPVQFGSGRGLSLLGAKIYGEPTLPSGAGAVGSWSGPGEVKPVVRVMGGGNDIVVMNCTVQGHFNYLAVDRAGATGRLRITDKDNTLACPIIARDDMQINKLHRKASSADFIRVLNDTDNTGHSYVGEISLPAGGPTYLASAINPLLADLSTMAVDAGETLAEIYSKYSIRICIKYVPGALSQQVKFGLASSATASHVQSTFFGVFGAAVAPVANSIGGVLHPLVDGEWIPLDIPLNQIIYSGANTAALTNFIVLKSTNPTTYDLTITKPVLVYVGAPPKSP